MNNAHAGLQPSPATASGDTRKCLMRRPYSHFNSNELVRAFDLATCTTELTGTSRQGPLSNVNGSELIAIPSSICRRYKLGGRRSLDHRKANNCSPSLTA